MVQMDVKLAICDQLSNKPIVFVHYLFSVIYSNKGVAVKF